MLMLSVGLMGICSWLEFARKKNVQWKSVEIFMRGYGVYDVVVKHQWFDIYRSCEYAFVVKAIGVLFRCRKDDKTH